MAKAETNKISRLLTIARERGEIPWRWIVDETREAERCSAWDAPADFANSVINIYRRDYWTQQPIAIQVWSEKGTVRGTLAPMFNAYGVTFRVMHGFTSATTANEIAEEVKGSPTPMLGLYVGDFDPSGVNMSEVDLPGRLARYGAKMRIVRLAITQDDATAKSGLPHFEVGEKRADLRYPWFVRNYGHRCVELDALDPRILRSRVEHAIRAEIDFDAWGRCEAVEQAEHRSLVEVMESWVAPWPVSRRERRRTRSLASAGRAYQLLMRRSAAGRAARGA